MRICIDLTSLADNFSGIERYAAKLSLELIKNYDEQYVLLFKNDVHPFFKEYCEKKNINMVVIPGGNKLFFNQIKLPWVIHKVKADWYLFMAFPVPVLTFKKNVISTIHDICCWDCPETMNGMSKWYFRISHRIAIKKCCSIITISEFSKQRIHEMLRYPKDKIWLIYCGIDIDELHAHPNRANLVRKKYNLPEEYILSLSTLEPRKNISLLIRAYSELIKEGCNIPTLVLAGRKGWKMDAFFEAIDPDIKKKIVFTGFIDDADLADVYGNAVLFVFPSLYEGFGMPPLEALACGVPVLSSNASSLPEVLGNSVFYFESENIDSLKASLVNWKEFKKISIDDIKKQVGRFSWVTEAKKLYELLQTRSKKNESWN